MNSDKKYYFGNSAFSLSCALVIGVCAYLTRRLTSNGLPGDEYAFFFSTFSLISMMVAFASLGIPNAAFFCIPDARNRGRDDEACSFYAWCIRWCFAVGVFLSVVVLPVVLLAGNSMERYGIKSDSIFRLLLLLPFPLCIFTATTMLLNGMKEFVASNLLQLLNTLTILCGIWLFQSRFGLSAVILVYAAGSLLAGAGAILWARRKYDYSCLHPIAAPERTRLVKTGGWLLLSCAGYYYFTDLGNVMLSYLGTPEETELFNIALPVALMIRPLYALSEVFAPLSNRLYQEKEIRTLLKSLWSMIGLTLVMMLGAGVVFAFLGKWILTLLFGEQFTGATPCTLILIEGAFLWNAARFCSDMLNSMHRERLAAIIVACDAVISVLLYYLFCPLHGADGTAWAALIASAVWLLAVLITVLFVLNLDAAREKSPRKILLFHSGSIGDTLLSFPSLKVIRAKWPDAEIVLFSYSAYTGLACVRELLLPSGLVDRIIGFTTSGSVPEIVLRLFLSVPRIRREHFDLAVNINQTAPKYYALRMKLWRVWCLFGGIKHWMGDRSLFIFPPIRPGGAPPVVPQHLDMIAVRLEADGIMIPDRRIDMMLTDEEIRRAQSIWDGKAAAKIGSRIPVAAGIGGKKQRWPIERFEELFRRTGKIGIIPVFFGGRENRAEIDRIIARLGFGFNAADAGLDSLRETVAFMSNCKFYVGNDTGTIHMAVAAGLKCIGIYSAQNIPGAWNPYGEGHIVLRHDLPCTGCFAAVCPKGRPACIEDISVDEVESAVVRMIDSLRSAGPT